jgi:hypothetical protein
VDTATASTSTAGTVLAGTGAAIVTVEALAGAAPKAGVAGIVMAAAIIVAVITAVIMAAVIMAVVIAGDMAAVTIVAVTAGDMVADAIIDIRLTRSRLINSLTGFRRGRRKAALLFALRDYLAALSFWPLADIHDRTAGTRGARATLLRGACSRLDLPTKPLRH